MKTGEGILNFKVFIGAGLITASMKWNLRDILIILTITRKSFTTRRPPLLIIILKVMVGPSRKEKLGYRWNISCRFTLQSPCIRKRISTDNVTTGTPLPLLRRRRMLFHRIMTAWKIFDGIASSSIRNIRSGRCEILAREPGGTHKRHFHPILQRNYILFGSGC